MELDKNIEQELAGLLADPEKVSPQHTAMLNDLLQQYPYYQPLHLLLAKASLNSEERNNALAKASLYTNGQTLHRFLFEKREIKGDFQLNEAPAAIGADLPVVTDEQETFEEISEPLSFASYEPAGVASHEPVTASQTEHFIADTEPAEAIVNTEGETEEGIASSEEIKIEEVTAEDDLSVGEYPTYEEKLPVDEDVPLEEQHSLSDEQETFEEISETAAFSQLQSIPVPDEQHLHAEGHLNSVVHSAEADEQETYEEISEPDGIAHFETIPAPTVADIPAEDISPDTEENIFEEIGEVDYNAYRPFRNSAQADEPSKPEEASTGFYTVLPKDRTAEESLPEEDLTESIPDTAESVEDLPEQKADTESDIQKNTFEDDFVFESIVSSDFFAFENNFSAVEEVEPEKAEIPAPPVIEEHDEAAAAEVANSRVSNYNDDKLPYTFLWWLAKTRKEHESFQPYVAAKKPGSNELQQQYVEHIFHIQSHLTGTEALLDSTEEPKPVSRDFQIIDSFIKNDPQIHPPNAEQIDNENKAKKSAEDQNDLVSETLAGIYIEQMLYDKAIDTYEKLSLKFPEKSRYFADLIQSIEKKI